MRKPLLLLALAAVTTLTWAPSAAGHLERPSYWPDPRPDFSVMPPAGGAVPKARSLTSAANGKTSGRVRVVCQGRRGKKSLRAAIRSIRKARRQGFKLRPSQPTIKYTRKNVVRMTRINRKLARKCRYKTIQGAVNRSGNNDRIVIMPGTYTEPKSRAKPVNDKNCNPSMLQKDASGSPTPSYKYQASCPNDQNLVYVQGRSVAGPPPATPRMDRQGIPTQEVGPCIRCNLQIEGSGPKPTDVIIDAGKDYQGTGPSAKPGGYTKHVVMRVDRADGFVGRNFLLRGGLEFGFYVEETDGVLLDKTKFYWNADYGHLSFTSDHAVVQNCDSFGAGDAAVYPGAAPETGSQATSFYPDAPRANTVITKCDLRGSALGYSGSMGNAVRITNNHIYGNTTGIASDTLSAAGHPGFPADSSEIDNNYIYSNNLNLYRKDAPVKALVAVPVGTGILYGGMNDARVHDNWIFDNWRDGAMLLAVPDALVNGGGAEGSIFPGISCAGAPENKLSTSCGNRFYGNRMGQVPPGFAFPKEVDQFRIPRSPQGATRMPNGNDFWWDEFATNRWNCWYGNTGADGSAGSVTGAGEAGRTPGTPPNPLPNCAGGTSKESSVGLGDPAKERYLVDCSEGPDTDTGPLDCDWWTTPRKPGSAAASARAAEFSAAAQRYASSKEGIRMRERMAKLAGG